MIRAPRVRWTGYSANRAVAQGLRGRPLIAELRSGSGCARIVTWEETVMHERNRPFAHSRAGSMLRRTPLAAAVSGVLAATALPTIALAQDNGVAVEEIVVTATRREQNIQDIPINIASFDGNVLETRAITDLAELGRNVPGLYVVETGKRSGDAIVVRGLNLDQITATDGKNNGGNVVSTYIGDIPLYVDFALNDIQRVEVLLGPQGTLYGSGTLGGAIRYLPNRPQFDSTSFDFRASTFDLAESDTQGWRGGVMANVPIGDKLAFRGNVDYYDDPGFIDQPYLVREVGVSDPEPNLQDPAAVAANLYRKNDVNWEQTLSGRAALRWRPTDAIDANLTYYYQDMDIGGRQQNNVVSFGTGKYESANRVLEPNERTNKLGALEVNVDLGFATLTSATGYSTYKDRGHRDQTDLLITLEYGYEAFPSFTAYTYDAEEDRNISQELRLVSKGKGPLTWIGGLFYYSQNERQLSEEFTPHYAEFLGGSRPDSLEYISYEVQDQTEKAIFGEVGYNITDRWQVTVGGRWYKYDLIIDSGVDVPLARTVFGGDPPDSIDLGMQRTTQGDSGSLYKFNTSYHFTDRLMGYLTVSEGFRLGAANGVAACTPEQIANPTQVVCALPAEVQYFPDTTTNYEIGIRSQWLDRRLTFNGAVYHIDWKDPQLASVTVNGSQPIIKNGDGAKSDGIELSLDAKVTNRITVGIGYSHTKAVLTAVAPGILRVYEPPGFGPPSAANPGAGPDPIFATGQPGDRLPGSPQQQGTLNFAYGLPLTGGKSVDFNYGIAAIGDIITTIGERAGGQKLGGYAVHNASAVWHNSHWSAGLYAQNLLNKYAITGVRSREVFVQTVTDENGDPVHVRSYSENVLRPREIGLRFTYSLGQ
jgi:outer membrane receptor protein involved in Fe transport